MGDLIVIILTFIVNSIALFLDDTLNKRNKAFVRIIIIVIGFSAMCFLLNSQIHNQKDQAEHTKNLDSLKRLNSLLTNKIDVSYSAVMKVNSGLYNHNREVIDSLYNITKYLTETAKSLEVSINGGKEFVYFTCLRKGSKKIAALKNEGHAQYLINATVIDYNQLMKCKSWQNNGIWYIDESCPEKIKSNVFADFIPANDFLVISNSEIKLENGIARYLINYHSKTINYMIEYINCKYGEANRIISLKDNKIITLKIYNKSKLKIDWDREFPIVDLKVGSRKPNVDSTNNN